MKYFKEYTEFIAEGKDGGTGDQKEYQDYRKKILKKYGVESASELSTEKKKEYYDEIDAGWQGENESD